MEIKKTPIQITEFCISDELPDIFLMNNGRRVSSEAEWQERRKELYDTAVTLQYGTIPPKAEALEIEPLYISDTKNTYRIHAGTKEKKVTFHLNLSHPADDGPWQTAVDGDGCWEYAYDREWYGAFKEHHYAFAFFDRTELAHDIWADGRKGQLYDVYPEYSFGAIGAWAWGYRTVTDALSLLGLLDPSLLSFTGHSRGGKAALLAGVIDERATIVNPNESGAGGAGCYRIHMKALQEEGIEERSETLKDLYRNFPFWLGNAMADFIDREEKLPFDEHFLKALVAPRILLTGDACSDIWANPEGAHQTTEAAKEVYRYLGKPENLYWYFRPGHHAHEPHDITRLIDVMNHTRSGQATALKYEYFNLPYEAPDKAFSWQAPGQ